MINCPNNLDLSNYIRWFWKHLQPNQESELGEVSVALEMKVVFGTFKRTMKFKPYYCLYVVEWQHQSEQALSHTPPKISNWKKFAM